MTGGKRPGAGRPATPIDEKRMMTLIGQKVSQRDIAKRFGVPAHVISYRLLQLKERALHENNKPGA